jgi:hypothetical protein
VVHNYPLPDFIIRYKDDKKNEDNKEDENQNKDENHRIKRNNFEILLLQAGLILEHEIDTDGIYTYIKIIAPFETLCEMAQRLKLKIRINVSLEFFFFKKKKNKKN